MFKKIESVEPYAAIIEEILSDESIVYDVRIYNDEDFVDLPCINLESARAILSAIKNGCS